MIAEEETFSITQYIYMREGCNGLKRWTAEL